MANVLVKRFVKKDGSQRISFYRDEYAENPREIVFPKSVKRMLKLALYLVVSTFLCTFAPSNN